MNIEKKIEDFLNENDSNVKGVYVVDNGTLKLTKDDVKIKKIDDIVISTSEFRVSDIKTIFDTNIVYLTDTIDIPSLLVELGIYNSKGIAKSVGRTGSVEDGYSEIKASKTRMLYIWNPRTRKSIKEYLKNK